MVYFTFSRVVAPQVPEYLAFRVPVGQVPSPLLPPFAYLRLRSFFGVSVVTFWSLFIFLPYVLTFRSPLVILYYLFFLRWPLRDCATMSSLRFQYSSSAALRAPARVSFLAPPPRVVRADAGILGPLGKPHPFPWDHLAALAVRSRLLLPVTPPTSPFGRHLAPFLPSALFPSLAVVAALKTSGARLSRRCRP